jgi:molybdopterin-guanine dinucleotide biosynthesis protein A
MTLPRPGGVIAAILAGGEGRRFGSEKGLALFRGEPMVAWAIRAARMAAETAVIIANRPELYAGFGCPVHRDVIKGMGPLSGLHAAFHVTGAEEVLALACDMPLAGGDMAKYLVARIESFAGDAAIPLVNGREQGLFAVYRRSAITRHMARIEAASIQFDEFRMGLEKLLIGEDELRRVEAGLESFINVNRVEDLALIERAPPVRR